LLKQPYKQKATSRDLFPKTPFAALEARVAGVELSRCSKRKIVCNHVVMPLLKRLDIKTNELYVCSFSADGTRALTGAQGSPVQLWDVAAVRPLRDFGDHSLASWAVEWTDDRHVIFGARDGTIVVADGENGRALQTLRGHTGFVRAIDSKQQTLISASGASDGELMLWNVRNGQCARKLDGHADGVYSVALNTDRNRVLSGSRDGTVRVWDAVDGRCLAVLEGHNYHVQSVAWSGDEHYAISCSTISACGTSRHVSACECSRATPRRSEACSGPRIRVKSFPPPMMRPRESGMLKQGAV